MRVCKKGELPRGAGKRYMLNLELPPLERPAYFLHFFGGDSDVFFSSCSR